MCFLREGRYVFCTYSDESVYGLDSFMPGLFWSAFAMFRCSFAYECKQIEVLVECVINCCCFVLHFFSSVL